MILQEIFAHSLHLRAGEKPKKLQIWRVQKFGLEDVEPLEFGFFQAGACYIILHRRKPNYGGCFGHEAIYGVNLEK